MEKPSEFHQLFEKYKAAKKAKADWATLEKKREELNETLDTFCQQLEHLLLMMHQKSPYDEKAAKRLEEQVAQKQELVDKLKKKKAEYDATLDQLEEQSEEDIEKIREKLVSLILAAHPEQKESYLELHKELTLAHQLEQESSLVLKLLNKPSLHLDKIRDTRAQVKRKGIFSYIFGPNPNAMIAIHLFALKQEIETLLPKIETVAANTKGGDFLREIYAEIITFLGTLKSQCEERWGYKKLDTIIAKTNEKLNEFDCTFTSLHSNEKEKGEILENKLDSWIEGNR